MKQVKIRRWQLLRWRCHREVADLREAEVVAVGKRAFVDQAELEEVLFPPTLSAIKTAAFAGCPHLHRVVFDVQNSVGLAANAFADCGYLREISGSEMLSVIGTGAFARCRNLRVIPFGRDLRRIGAGAFAGCSSLEALKIPSCVETVGEGAFSDCCELSRVELEDGLTVLGIGMFRRAIALEVPAFPESIRVIPSECFRGCSAFDVLRLPGSVRSLGTGAFRDCSRLSEVTAELGLAEIGALSFLGCRDLAAVRLPHSVKRIGFGAFGFGWSRKKIRILADNEYMLKKLRRMLLFCGSLGRVSVEFDGKTLSERRRERHRKSLDSAPTHIS